MQMRGEGCLHCQTIARLHGAVKWYAVKWCAVKWYAVIWYAVKWCAAHEACLHKGILQKGRQAREALSESAAVRQQACLQPSTVAASLPPISWHCRPVKLCGNEQGGAPAAAAATLSSAAAIAITCLRALPAVH